VLEYIQDLAKPECARITNIEALDQVERHGFDAIRIIEPTLRLDAADDKRVVNGVMIPAHRELVIVRPGYWVRTESVLEEE
jgi:hypothetical protein